MSKFPKTILPLRSEHDVVRCRQAVRQLATDTGFKLTGQTMLMTATSELARNTVKYGGGGQMTHEVVTAGNAVGIKLTFEDQGPGITDIALAMSDGWSSGGGLGLGLSGAKRLVHDFHIASTTDRGTTVVILRWR